MHPRFLGVVCAAAITLMTACGSSPTQPATGTNQPQYTVSSFVTAVQAADGSQAVVRSGTAPTAQSGPTVTLTGNASVINGGSNLVRVRSSSAFQVVYVYVGNVSGGVSGYWELRLSSASTDILIVITFSRALPVGGFDCVFGAGSSGGAVGAYSGIPQTVVTQASTGVVQISAAWDALSDVDVHVIEPGGTEVYWSNRTAASGGALDLDSNAGCSIDRVNNENIRWPIGRAVAGTYTVRLDYWSSCGVAQTNYVVTVNNGGNTSVYRGSFTGTGDRGNRGAGVLITQFAYSASVAASALMQELGNLFVAPNPSVDSRLSKASAGGSH